jgi:GGDEF domain-containing protein
MRIFDRVSPANLESRELHLSIFVSVTVSLLAVGTAVLMYPTVFSRQAPADPTLRIAFFGYCALCVLLGFYLWERHATIRRLRSQMAEDRRQMNETRRQAGVELLKTMPNFSSFQDRLPMEFRRTATTTQKLSIVVINCKFPPDHSSPSETSSALGDAAKVIARKVREEDSIYILAPACFGAVLPGADLSAAQRVCKRLDEGLADAAGANRRFQFELTVVNYPAHASSAHELQQAVSALIVAENSMQGMAEALN